MKNEVILIGVGVIGYIWLMKNSDINEEKEIQRIEQLQQQELERQRIEQLQQQELEKIKKMNEEKERQRIEQIRKKELERQRIARENIKVDDKTIDVLQGLSGSAYWAMRKRFGNDAEIRNVFGTNV